MIEVMINDIIFILLKQINNKINTVKSRDVNHGTRYAKLSYSYR